MDINYVINSITNLNTKPSKCNGKITPELREILTSTEFISVVDYPMVNRLLSYLTSKYTSRQYYQFSLYTGFSSFVTKKALNIIKENPLMTYYTLQKIVENIMDNIVDQYLNLLYCYKNEDQQNSDNKSKKLSQYKKETEYQNNLRTAGLENIGLI